MGRPSAIHSYFLRKIFMGHFALIKELAKQPVAATSSIKLLALFI